MPFSFLTSHHNTPFKDNTPDTLGLREGQVTEQTGGSETGRVRPETRRRGETRDKERCVCRDGGVRPETRRRGETRDREWCVCRGGGVRPERRQGGRRNRAHQALFGNCSSGLQWKMEPNTTIKKMQYMLRKSTVIYARH